MLEAPTDTKSFVTCVAELHDQNRSEAEGRFSESLAIVDEATFVLFSLLMIARERSASGFCNLWPSLNHRVGPDGRNLYLEATLDTLLNAFLGARAMAVVGLDNEARTLVRRAAELADFAKCFLGDVHFFHRFLQTPRSEVDKREKWKKVHRPSVLRQAAARVERNLGFPAEIANDLAQERSQSYSWLSQSSHADPEGLYCGTFRRPLEDRDEVLPAFCGMVGVSSSGTLKALSQIAWLGIPMLRKLLVEKHSWIDLNNQQGLAFRRIDHLFIMGAREQIKHSGSL